MHVDVAPRCIMQLAFDSRAARALAPEDGLGHRPAQNPGGHTQLAAARGRIDCGVYGGDVGEVDYRRPAVLG